MTEIYLCDDCASGYTFYGINPVEYKAWGKCDDCGKNANLYRVQREQLHVKPSVCVETSKGAEK